MTTFIEILSITILMVFFTFPFWIHNNWYTIFFDKKAREYNRKHRKDKKYGDLIKGRPVIQRKICTEHQPYKLNEKEYVICNFQCDGKCTISERYKIG
jgi:hypothetical protein